MGFPHLFSVYRKTENRFLAREEIYGAKEYRLSTMKRPDFGDKNIQ
jgi:hypothetical protein